MNDTYFSVANRWNVWFKTDDYAEACRFVMERADEDMDCDLYVVRHTQSTGERKIVYTAMERITEMYGD